MRKISKKGILLDLGTELGTRNKIQSNCSLAVSVLKYSVRIINCGQEEQQKLNNKQGNC
jgi:hypothetical protein